MRQPCIVASDRLAALVSARRLAVCVAPVASPVSRTHPVRSVTDRSTRRLRRRAQVFSLAVLLLVPVVLAGHFHTGVEAAAASCQTCVAVRHTPSTGAAPAPTLQTVRVDWPLMALAEPIVSTQSHAIPRTGRSPPPFGAVVS